VLLTGKSRDRDDSLHAVINFYPHDLTRTPRSYLCIDDRRRFDINLGHRNTWIVVDSSAMTSVNPAINSPKRKRNEQLRYAKTASPSRLETTVLLPGNETPSGSPRTAVACHFQGLHLDGDNISKLDLGCSSHISGPINDGDIMRKRVKKDTMEIPETPLAPRICIDSNRKMEIPETPKAEFGSSGPASKVEFTAQKPTGESSKSDGEKPPVFKGLSAHSRNLASKLSRAYPSINRLADSKSCARRRMGTPPLSTSTDKTEDTVVDPDRAALTWHDDEITGHDPSDPDDDGEGINGIGFKPTPAQANARAERRRQQMAEYKSREMKEARAKRSERRRGSQNAAIESRGAAARKVRFSEADANVMVTT
jgi:hypothetical protein